MDRYEAARVLGVADADVLNLAEGVHGVEVDVRDGGRRLIRDDGIYAIGEHPGSAHLRRWKNVTVAPESSPAEPDRSEPDGETVPDGTAQEVLAWVDGDPTRAAAALAEEEKRDNPRSVLISKLRKVADR